VLTTGDGGESTTKAKEEIYVFEEGKISHLTGL